MGWSIYDLIQFTQDLIGSDVGNHSSTDSEPGEFMYADDDDQASSRQSPNLSVEDARQSLDEYEAILRS